MQLPEVGDVFMDRYELHDELGRGGFGVVFGAWDRRNKRRVVLKLLSPGRDGYSPTAVARFQREAGTFATLRSPYIVTMFDHGSTPEGLLYIVLEHIDGRDLKGILAARGPLGEVVTLHILRQVLEGLVDAHRLGILHRDIKPANILVYEYAGDPWRVKLIDFGLAKVLDDPDAQLTHTGHVVGTPKYMAPEQFYDQALSHRTDLYSVGIVGTELLLGSDCFGGSIDPGVRRGVVELADLNHATKEFLVAMLEPEPERRIEQTSVALEWIRALVRGDFDGALEATVPERRDELRGNVDAPQRTVDSDDSSRWVRASLLVALAVIGVSLTAVIMTRSDDVRTPEPAAVNRSALLRSSTPPRAAPSGAATEGEQEAVAVPTPAAVVAPPSSGCGQRPPRGLSMQSESVAVTPLEQFRMRYAMYLPASYTGDVPVPLLVVLHPDFQEPDRFLKITGFDDVAEREGFAVVAPTIGDRVVWRNETDVEQVAMLVDTVMRERLCVDQKRVFAVGHDSGGIAVHDLSCTGLLAAAATNSFRPLMGQRPCADKPGPPMLTLNPLQTSQMPVEGGMNCYGSQRMSLELFDQYWRKRNRCMEPDEMYFESGNHVCRTSACEVPYVTCHLDGGLGWPGSPQRPFADYNRCDGTPPDFPTQDVIWKFFAEVSSSESP